ncbi:hypothetical protein V1509DRAFT_621879 [Lipomyces kononenkoae]
MASAEDTNETKIDRVMSQRWVDFKRTALRYEDGDQIYEELGDDDYYDDYSQNASRAHDSESSQSHIPGAFDATPPHNPQVSNVSTDADIAPGANDPGQNDAHDSSAHRGTSQTPSEPTIATSMPDAAASALGPTVRAREPPKPLNINVAIAQQAAPISSNTSLDSSIPSSIADHEYSGLNRFGGLLASENRDATQLDEVIESVDERDDESDKQPEDEQQTSSGLRIASLADENPHDSPAGESADIDAQSTSLDHEAAQQQPQYPVPAVADEHEDNADESIRRSIQNLSLNRPVDSSVSSSETGSIDRIDSGSVRVSYAGYSDRRSSYASTSDSARLRLEDTTYNTTTESDDYFKIHDRSISTGTNRSESEIMTDKLLEQLAAEQAIDSRRKSMPREDTTSSMDQKLRVDGASPRSPQTAHSNVFLERPPSPLTLPSITTEEDSVKERAFGSEEERVDDASQQSPVSTAETNAEADDSEMYYETSGDPASESARGDLPEPNVPTIYLSAPYPGPRWNFKEILKEPNPVKRKILFDAARKMEQRYESGLDQWLLYMVHQRNDVDPYEMSAVGNDVGKVGHHTIHHTTSMIGHSVSRYSGKSVEMMERVGEKSKGIFHRSKLFGNKMTSEFELTAKEEVADSSAQSNIRRVLGMHPVFKDSFISSIRRSTDVSVYMVASIEYTSAVADSRVVTPTRTATSSAHIDEDLSALEATKLDVDAVPQSTLIESQTSDDPPSADPDFDVNAILLAYEDASDSTKDHTIDTITAEIPSDSSPPTLRQHKSLRDFEPTLFTLPKVRSSARIAAMRAASVTTHNEKDRSEPTISHTSASAMTQRRVVTTSALPESTVDFIEIDSITKSFLSNELAVFDEIGNFDQASPKKSVNVNYVVPKSMLLADTETPPPRITSLKSALTNKPLPQGPPISSDEPVVVRPKGVPSFELGIPESQRSERITAKLKGLSKLKLSKSLPRLQAEKFKQESQNDHVIESEPQSVEEKALPTRPAENNVVTQVAAAPRSYAKRKPVGGVVQADSEGTVQLNSPSEIKASTENAKPSRPTPHTYIVKPLPMEPGPPHVQQSDILPSDSRRPKAVTKEQPAVEAKRPSKPTDFMNKFRDLMQMDAMGITPATRTQINEANSESGNSAGTKSVKVNMRMIRERLTKRTAEHGAAQTERNTIPHTSVSKEQRDYIQQYDYNRPNAISISTSRTPSNVPGENIDESTVRVSSSSALEEGTSKPTMIPELEVLDLSLQPTVNAQLSSPAVEPVVPRSMTRPESLLTDDAVQQNRVSSITASDSLQNIVESYGKLSSEQDTGSPPQAVDKTGMEAVTGALVTVTESQQKFSAASSMLILDPSAQSNYHTTPNSDIHTNRPDVGQVEPQVAMESESEPSADFALTSSAGLGETASEAGRERYRRRRSSMPEWSPINDNMGPRRRLSTTKSQNEDQKPVLENELTSSSRTADSQNPDLLGDPSVYRHHKSNSDPELAGTVATSSTTNFSGDRPQVIKRSEFERQQAAQRAQNGEPATKIVYVVPDEYVLAERPMYMRPASPAMRMQAQYLPPGRMMVDPRSRPPPRPGMRAPPPGYMRRPPQQFQQWPPQKRPPVHRPPPQALGGPGQSQRLRLAHLMDSEYASPMFDNDQIPPGRPYERNVRGGMIPSRDYYKSHSPDRVYRASDENLARSGRQRPVYATPPPPSSSSAASISSAAGSSQASSAGFGSTGTANEHMLRMATTPDFDAGSLVAPRRFPKRHF